MQTYSCLKSTVETLGKGVEYVQSYIKHNIIYKNTINIEALQ